MNKGGENRHLDYIDLAKGIGIIGIVGVHVLKNTYNNFPHIRNWVSFFMITIFYVVFGWIGQTRDKSEINIKQLIKKRLYSLGIPYVCFSIIIICFDIVLLLFRYGSFKQILSDVYRTICLAGIGTLWFLPTLFIAEIMFYFMLQKGKKIFCLSFIVSFIVAIIGVYVLNSTRTESMIYDIFSAPIIAIIKSLFGFLFGSIAYFACKSYNILEEKLTLVKRVILSICFVAIGVRLSYLVGSGDFNHLTMRYPIQYLIIASIVSFSIIILLKNICDMKIHSVILKFYGKNSLIVMATHYSLLMPCFNILTSYFVGIEAYNLYPYDLLIFISIILLEIPISLGIQRYCPFIIGKNRQKLKEIHNRKISVSNS